MNLAWLSVGALAAAVALSCFTQLNVGLIAIAFAWIVGGLLGGMSARQIAGGFPSELFLTLAGVTLLFAQAQTNGTLERLARHAARLCRGNAGLLPPLFFVLASALASLGPGNIASAALLAPMAMAAALRTSIPPFLMAIMVGNGASSGSLSPFAPTGIIVNGLMDRMGLAGFAFQNWSYNLAAHAAVAFSAYLVFGGLALFRRGRASVAPAPEAVPAFERRHWLTLAVIALLLASVLFAKAPVGLAAFAAAALISILRAADEAAAVRNIPWNTLLMVCGVTVLIAILEKTQGMDLFAGLIARLSTPTTVTAVVAFVTGLVSVYSSTSGVVLPAFLPAIPPLIEKLGGGDALWIASSMNVGGHLVDVSPLSTLGALCLAAIPRYEDSRRLFYQLLAWGLSMSVVGAIVCFLLFR
jgi:di/tricarboxylate transporter